MQCSNGGIIVRVNDLYYVTFYFSFINFEKLRFFDYSAAEAAAAACSSMGVWVVSPHVIVCA